MAGGFSRFVSRTSSPRAPNVATSAPASYRPIKNGVCERAFGSLKCERLYREAIDDALNLTRHSESFRVEFNAIRPQEAMPGTGPHDAHTGRAPPEQHPGLLAVEILPIVWRGQSKFVG